MRWVDSDARARYALTRRTIATLPDEAVVLSPLPVTDELDPKVRADSRVRMFEQSDIGVLVRMAI